MVWCIYSLLHCACCPGTTCFLSASFLRHFSLAIAGLRAPLSRFLEGALHKYPEWMNEWVRNILRVFFFQQWHSSKDIFKETWPMMERPVIGLKFAKPPPPPCHSWKTNQLKQTSNYLRFYTNWRALRWYVCTFEATVNKCCMYAVYMCTSVCYFTLHYVCLLHYMRPLHYFPIL